MCYFNDTSINNALWSVVLLFDIDLFRISLNELSLAVFIPIESPNLL